MSDAVAAVAIAALIALVASLALRVAGVLFVLEGCSAEATGLTQELIVALMGASRGSPATGSTAFHHHYSSPARQAALPETPLRRIDATRGRGVPTLADDHEPRGRSLRAHRRRRACAAGQDTRARPYSARRTSVIAQCVPQLIELGKHAGSDLLDEPPAGPIDKRVADPCPVAAPAHHSRLV
jgi:hypothetical protein